MQAIIDYILTYARENLILVIIGLMTTYQTIYIIMGVFCKKKTFKETDILKNYAIIISARNEEFVIGNLINSLKQQNYDQDKLTIFVVADNCTDKTKDVATKHGAIVYERFSEKEKRKGYALKYLFKNLDLDYGITSFDGYIFFDADNLVHPNFVKEINKAFVEKGGVVSGYRNIKNFDSNFVSSAYGIHFYRSAVALNRPRTLLGLGTHVAGTGYVIDSELLKDGWNYTSLTEDAEMTVDLSIKGVIIQFCEDAIFYDEQPTSLKVSFRQRKRWTVGRLGVFLKYFPKIIFNIFKRMSFTLYDFFFYYFPWPFLSLFKTIIIPLTIGMISKEIIGWDFWQNFALVLISLMVGLFLNNFLFGLLVVIKERNKIPTTKAKKIKAIITYPWFNMVTIFIALTVFIDPFIEWHPIVHDDLRSIDDIKST